MASATTVDLYDMPAAARRLVISEDRLRRVLEAHPEIDARCHKLARRRVLTEDVIEELLRLLGG